jgi:hypothetical protein
VKFKQASYLEHYFVSNLTSEETDRALKTFSKLGLFKNVSYEYFTKTLKSWSFPEENPKFKIRADLTKCSPQEYQVVGFFLRDFTNDSQAIKKWLYLMDLLPKTNKFWLYLTAKASDGSCKTRFGHNWFYNCTYTSKALYKQSLKSIVSHYSERAAFMKANTRYFDPQFTNMLYNLNYQIPKFHIIFNEKQDKRAVKEYLRRGVR